MSRLEDVVNNLPVEQFDSYVEELDRLYIYTTADPKRLPIYVTDTVEELAELTGSTVASINSIISKRRSGKLKTSRFDRVEYEGYKPKTGKCKLNETQARELHRLYYAENVPMNQLEEASGVSRNAILGSFKRLGLPTSRKGKNGL